KWANAFVLWSNSERFNLENDDSRDDPPPRGHFGRTREKAFSRARSAMQLGNAQNAGRGVGPKNNRNIFSLPITRTNSRAVQYARIRINRMICTAQKCGQTIPARSFSLPATMPPACRENSINRST